MSTTLQKLRRAQFDVISIFPEIIESYCASGVLGRAVQKRLVRVRAIQLRDFARDRHRTVDDRPYGGGPGMVMKLEPLIRALRACGGAHLGVAGKKFRAQKERRIILLSPRGRQFTQSTAVRLSRYRHVTFIAGRYEGVDERIMGFIDEMISLGPYVLSGGELAALAMIDASARLIPGVLGNKESSVTESFSRPAYREYPHYTRPPRVAIKGKELKVPATLLEGDHRRIEAWRMRNSRGSSISKS